MKKKNKNILFYSTIISFFYGTLFWLLPVALYPASIYASKHEPVIKFIINLHVEALIGVAVFGGLALIVFLIVKFKEWANKED